MSNQLQSNFCVTVDDLGEVVAVRDDFPCNVNAITAVSLAVGAAACALIFVVFLLKQVSLEMTPKIRTN